MDRAELEALLARVAGATGPDRDLDADLHEAFGGCAHRETEYYCIEDGNDTDSGFTCKRCGVDTYGRSGDVKPVTASIDAAVALLDRVLPGWDFHLWRDQDDNNRYVAEMTWPDGALTPDAGYFGCEGCAPTRARAIVAGVLEAKIALLAQEHPHA